MNYKKILIILYFSLLFIACGKEEEEKKNFSNTTLHVSAGEDQSVFVNNSILLTGTGSSTLNNPLSYEWKKEKSILSTSRTVEYTPTTIGTDILDFAVTDNSGLSVTDSINILVNEFHSIPAIKSTNKKHYLKVLNEARAEPRSCGEKGNFPATTALIWNEKLYKSAYEHSQDMAKSNTFDHKGSGTKSDWTGTVLNKQSILSERYATYNYHWIWSGENLTAGTIIDTPEEAMQKWLESDGHCANLMNPNFKEVGISMVQKNDSKYTYYWTQNFGEAQ